MSTPVIQLEDFRKTYISGEVEVHAVRGVTLSIQPGEFVAIMGASGSGKSTMMNTLGCLDRPTSGRFLLDGVNVIELNRDELADLRNRQDWIRLPGLQPPLAHHGRRERRAAHALQPPCPAYPRAARAGIEIAPARRPW